MKTILHVVVLPMFSKLQTNKNKKLISRWDSERELSLRRHRTRTI